jgi:RNA polymerase sigma factor (sigma-70 family)
MGSSFSEEEVARRARMEALFREHFAEVYRYIYSKVKQVALAEDLTSYVFLKAFRWLLEDRGSERVRSWLYATARTTIADYWQERERTLLLLLDGAEEMAYEVSTENGQETQAYERVQHLLLLLPPRDRQILTLRYLQGYSAAEVAQTLGLSAGNVRVLQLRALRRAALLEAEERSSTMASPVTTYSEQANRVLDFAREEAASFNHNYIGTEHLLLGILREGSAATLLHEQGVTVECIRGGIMFLLGRDQVFPGNVSTDFNPRVKKVLALAGEGAQSAGEAAIGPQHILLAIMREGEGLAAIMLTTLGVSLKHYCSFCYKPSTQVRRLFNAPPFVASGSPFVVRVHICDECINRLQADLNAPEN